MLCRAYRRQQGCDFISAMPTNLYGPRDNFDLTSSHVIPALIRKAHEAKVEGDAELVIWGTGNPASRIPARRRRRRRPRLSHDSITQARARQRRMRSGRDDLGARLTRR